jgi:hypothetical protein
MKNTNPQAGSRPIRLLQCGLGPLGLMTLRYLYARKGFEVVAAVDKSPDLIGKDLGDLLNEASAKGIVVSADLGAAIRETQPDVCLLMTVSDLARIEGQIAEVLKNGSNVVSTCEELAFPWERDAEIASRIDKLARENGKAVLGTGVNPGFLMDFLPQTLTGLCHHVETVLVERHQDASNRRLPFQRKIGAGLTVEAFQQRYREGSLRHVGLEESIHLIAARLGWKLDKTEDIIEPIIATEEWKSEHLTVAVGEALGVKQTGRGFRNGKVVITLDFQAAVGLQNPKDRIVIEGEPRIDSTITGGVQGDIATCSLALNTCSSILRATPGLHNMASLPGVSWYSGE